MPSIVPTVWIFALGLCIGSFLNVCIARLPGEGSLTDPPRSRCPRCGHTISFFDNIPLISYLWLRGRCRHCNEPISLRYPMVELLAGLLAVTVLSRFGFAWESLFYYAFLCALLVILFIDIDHQIIPDAISLPGVALGLIASLVPRSPVGFFPGLPGPVAQWAARVPVPEMTLVSLLGLLVGGGSLYLVAWGYHAMTGKEGMGGGDIKLLAMIGAMLGWEGVVFTLFAASALGTVVGLAMMAAARRRDLKLRIPFGPFLSLGAMGYLFFGAPIIYAYLSAAQG
jgi:leader peptidase (prepilin peptidase)/N-methyltransferase